MRLHDSRHGRIWRTGLVLGLLLAVVVPEFRVDARVQGQVAKRKGASNVVDRRPKPDWPPESGLSVLSARIGTQERWLDITRAVQARIVDNKLAGLPANLPDAAPGAPKAVVIVYSLDGKVGLSVTSADAPVSLPPSEAENQNLVAPPEAGLAILSARLGDAGKWEDVTPDLQKKVVKDKLDLAYPAAAKLPGYQDTKRQALALLYSRRGRIRFWLQRDDRPVSLPELKPDPSEPREIQHPTQDDLDYLKLLSPVFQQMQAPDELEQVKELDLADLTIDDLGLIHLRGLVRLRNLSLARTQIDDESLGELAHLGRLRALNLTGTAVTDAALKSLNSFEGLMALWLDQTAVSDAGMAVFEQLVNLELLALADTGVTDTGLAGLRKLRSLRSLDLSKRPGLPSASAVTDDGLSTLRSLSSLERLNLAGTAVNGSGLVQMRGISLLKQLDLSRTKVADDSIKWLLTASGLTSLKLGSTRVTDDGLNTILKLKNLTELDLQETGATNIFLDNLGKVTKQSENPAKFVSINLSKTKVTDAGLKSLDLFPSLQHLYLGETELRGTGLVDLPDLIHMRTLDLRQTRINDAALRNLRPMEDLRVLILANTRLTDAAIPHLKRLKRLEKLDLSGTQISPTGLKELQAALPQAEILFHSK